MKPTEVPSKGFYYLSLFAAQVMVGISIVASKYLLLHMPMLLILVVRFLFAAVFLLGLHFMLPPRKRKAYKRLAELTNVDWGFIIAQALCAGILFNFLLLLGLHYTSASVAGIITSILPAIIAVLAIIFLRERLTLLRLLCIIFAVLGLVVVNLRNFDMGDVHGLLGDVIILLALLPEAVYYILARMHYSGLPIFLLAALMNLINLPILIIAFFIVRPFQVLDVTWLSVFILLLVGLVSGLFYVFWFLGCREVSGTTAGLFTAVMPIATLMIAWVFLSESITLFQISGMVLVMLSIGFNALR